VDEEQVRVILTDHAVERCTLGEEVEEVVEVLQGCRLQPEGEEGEEVLTCVIRAM
jgi:hypothetical protein